MAVYDVDGRPGHPEHVQDGLLAVDMACREWIERQLLITKAGSQAEALLHDIPVERMAPRPSDIHAEQRLTTALSSLGGRALELLRAADKASEDDSTQAARPGEHLAGSEAHAHGVWMSAVSRRLVLDNWPAIERVARVLLDDQVMSGERVAETCKETP